MRVLEPKVSSRNHSLVGLFTIINRWKYLVIGVTLAAAVISAIVALSLPNVYKSTSVFYPIDLRAINPDRILDGDRDEVLAQREDIDRIITIGTSMPVAEYIIKKYDLYSHYGIDSARNDINQQQVLDEFMSNYDIDQNPREAIEVSFFDQNKELAAAIANDITERIDYLNRQLTYENRVKNLNIHQARYELMSQDYQKLSDSLRVLRKKYGVLDMGREDRSAGEYLAKQLVETEANLKQSRAELAELQKHYPASHERIISLKARISGLESAYSAMTSATSGNLINYESYVAGADLIESLSGHLAEFQLYYSRAKSAYDNARISLNSNIPTLYIVQKAYPATKKAKPIRWLIVVGTAFATFVLLVALISFIELYRSRRHYFQGE